MPVVTKVGGLVNTVVDFEESPEYGTGIMIEPDAAGVGAGIDRAFALYQDTKTYQKVQRRGMLTDFSWDRAALAYEEFYASEV